MHRNARVEWIVAIFFVLLELASLRRCTATLVPCPNASVPTVTILSSAYGCEPTFSTCSGSDMSVTITADCAVTGQRISVVDSRWLGTSSFVVLGSTNTALVVTRSSISTSDMAFSVDAAAAASVSNVSVTLVDTVVTAVVVVDAHVGSVLLPATIANVQGVTLATVNCTVTLSGAVTNQFLVASMSFRLIGLTFTVAHVHLVVSRCNITTVSSVQLSGVALIASFSISNNQIGQTSVANDVVLAVEASFVSFMFTGYGHSFAAASFFNLRLSSTVTNLDAAVSSSNITIVESPLAYANCFVAGVLVLGPDVITLTNNTLRIGSNSRIDMTVLGPNPVVGVAGVAIFQESIDTETYKVTNLLTAITDASVCALHYSGSSRGAAMSGVWIKTITNFPITVSIINSTFLGSGGSQLSVLPTTITTDTAVAIVGVVSAVLSGSPTLVISDTWAVLVGDGSRATCGLGASDTTCAVAGFASWRNFLTSSDTRLTRCGAIASWGTAAAVVPFFGAQSKNDNVAAVVGVTHRTFQAFGGFSIDNFTAIGAGAVLNATACLGFNCASAVVGVAVFKRSDSGAALISLVDIVTVAYESALSGPIIDFAVGTPSFLSAASCGVAILLSSQSGAYIVLGNVTSAVLGGSSLWGGCGSSSACSAGGLSVALLDNIIPCSVTSVFISSTDATVTVVGPPGAPFVSIGAVGFAHLGGTLAIADFGVVALRSTVNVTLEWTSQRGLFFDLVAALVGLALQADSISLTGVNITLCDHAVLHLGGFGELCTAWNAAVAAVSATTQNTVGGSVTAFGNVSITVSDNSMLTFHSDGVGTGNTQITAVAGMSVLTKTGLVLPVIANVDVTVASNSVVRADVLRDVTSAPNQSVACGVMAPTMTVQAVDVTLCDVDVTSTVTVMSVVASAGTAASLRVARSNIQASSDACLFGSPADSTHTVVTSCALNCSRLGSLTPPIGSGVTVFNATSPIPTAQWGFSGVTVASSPTEVSCHTAPCVDIAASVFDRVKHYLGLYGAPSTRRRRTSSTSATATDAQLSSTKTLKRRDHTRTRTLLPPTPRPSTLAMTTAPPALTNLTQPPWSTAAPTRRLHAVTLTHVMRRRRSRTEIPPIATVLRPTDGVKIVQVVGATAASALGSATVSVFSPAASARPGRLSATSQLASCAPDDSPPSIEAFPLQFRLVGDGPQGLDLGSSVLWTAVTVVSAVATLHVGPTVGRYAALFSAIVAAYFMPTIVAVCVGIVSHPDGDMLGAGRPLAAALVVGNVVLLLAAAWYVWRALRRVTQHH